MSDRDNLFSDENGEFVTSYLRMETKGTQNFACRLQLSLLLPVPHIIVIGVSEDGF